MSACPVQAVCITQCFQSAGGSQGLTSDNIYAYVLDLFCFYVLFILSYLSSLPSNSSFVVAAQMNNVSVGGFE